MCLPWCVPSGFRSYRKLAGSGILRWLPRVTRPACAAASQRLRPAFPGHSDKTMDVVVRDSNGNPLADGDSVVVIKDLKVKGSSVTLKRGTSIKNIRLNGSEGEIEANHEKVKGLVLKTEFLRKA
jgi:protein PhnA